MQIKPPSPSLFISPTISQSSGYAHCAHRGQVRKYGVPGELPVPYIAHPERVAKRAWLEKLCEDAVAAAWLHDVIEDCGVTADDLRQVFDEPVVALVVELTNPSKGLDLPRSERKQIDRAHLSHVSLTARTLKLLDRLDNVKDMHQAPLKFKRLYAEESRLLIEALLENVQPGWDVVRFAQLAAELREAITIMERSAS
jgi:(p)ppGpp synthase/HD superfamily hydrolase